VTAAPTHLQPLLTVEVDHRVDSPNRYEEHFRWRHRRRSGEAKATKEALSGHEQPPLPLRCRLVRCAPGRVDDDNLAGAFKAVRDAVARWLGTDDGPGGGVQWEYAQEKHRERIERLGRQGRVKVTHRVWFRIEFYAWDGCLTEFVRLDGPACGDEGVRIHWPRPRTETATALTDAHQRANGSVLRVARKVGSKYPHYVNVYWRMSWTWHGKQRTARTLGIAFREREELESVLPALQAELEAWPIEREADNDATVDVGADAGGVRDG
jgi:hypothetical protein